MGTHPSNQNGGNPASPRYGAGAGGFRAAKPNAAVPAWYGSVGSSLPWARHARSHVSGIRNILSAIQDALDTQKMPEHVPEQYRDAVVELLEACLDRRDDRMSRFDHAMKVLEYPLAIAQSDPELHSAKARIDWDVRNWRLTCASGPFPLPTNQIRERFNFQYVAAGGESILEVATKFGLENPAVMTNNRYGYHLHMRLRKGDIVFVPFPRAFLEALVEKWEKLKDSAERQLKGVLETLELAEKDLAATLLLIEAINVCANISAGLAYGAKEGMEAAKAGAEAARWARIAKAARSAKAGDEVVLAAAKKAAEYEHELHHLNKHMVQWALEEVGHAGADFLGWGLELSESVQGFFARHPNLETLWRSGPVSWLSPGYWAPLATAGWQDLRAFGFAIEAHHTGRDMGGQIASAKRDRDEALQIFWLGREGQAEKTRKEFEDRAEQKIEDLEFHIRLGRIQLSSGIYDLKS